MQARKEEGRFISSSHPSLRPFLSPVVPPASAIFPGQPFHCIHSPKSVLDVVLQEGGVLTQRICMRQETHELETRAVHSGWDLGGGMRDSQLRHMQCHTIWVVQVVVH